MDRINWVTSDCFHAIGQLARFCAGDDDGFLPELVHARMKAFLDAMVQRSREAGYSEQQTKLSSFALAALADEVAMGARGALREHWAIRPLQLVLFAENVAGERFFEYLESARQSPQHIDVLRVYYVCLLLGFRGRYGVRSAEVTLAELIDGVRAELERTLVMPDALSPNGQRPEDGLVDVAQRLPVLGAAFAVVALAGVLYLGLSVSLAEQLRQFVTWTQHAAAG